MKILKIFGIVVGIHVFALILIFANPGCSSTTKPAPAPADTVAKPAASPIINAPSAPASVYSSTTDSSAPAPLVTFNPDAPAAAGAAGSGGGARVMPTRPGTPVAGVLVAEPVTGVTSATAYTVKSGDSLWTIARKNNLTVAQLTAANNLSANASLRPGQKLLIPEKMISVASTAPAGGGMAPAAKSADPLAAAAGRVGAEGIKHTVKSGETLGAIARKYDVRQRDIAVANNIADPAKIRPGTELIIPGWNTPAGKTGKAPAKSAGSTKSASPAPAPAAEAPPAAEPPPAQSTLPPVPVIRIDDGPVNPAPRQP